MNPLSITNVEFISYINDCDDNIVQMTFNGYPICVDYSSSRGVAIISVSNEVGNWDLLDRYYICRDTSAPIHALSFIFRKDPSVIYNNKKYSIDFVYSGDKEDVKNNLLHTPWNIINSRWQAVQLNLWTVDSSDEQIREAERICSERLHT